MRAGALRPPYFSTAHFRRIVHGYVSYPPLITRLLRRLAAEFPSEATLQAFRRAGVDTVVVHHGRPVGVDLAEKLRWADARTRDEARPRLMREARLVLQLLEQLLRSPRGARVGFDLGGRTWSGISLLVSDTGTSYDGWLLPEIEVRVP